MDASDAALFATLTQAAPLGVAFFDTDLRCRRANEAMARLLGTPADDLVDRRPSEALADYLAPAVEETLRKVLDEGHPVIDADLCVAEPAAGAAGENGANGADEADEADVETRLLVCSWFPVYGPAPVTTQQASRKPVRKPPPQAPPPEEAPPQAAGGALLGVAVTAADVTERRRAEEVIRRKEQRYRSLVEASSQVVWVVSPPGEPAGEDPAAGSAVDDAPEWRAITGQSPDEYRAEGWLGVVHPEDRQRIETAWRDCVENNRIFETNYRIRTRSGTYRHFDVRAVPIWRGDEVVEWVGANTDVTGQREAEEMRGRLTEQLSAAALRTARLQQATSMLAEALTVSQVVQVITEVGRSAIGADNSAVALLDEEKLRLRIVTPALPPARQGQGGVTEAVLTAWDDIRVSDQTVMSVAVRESRPFLAESPDSLRLQLGVSKRGQSAGQAPAHAPAQERGPGGRHGAPERGRHGAPERDRHGAPEQGQHGAPERGAPERGRHEAGAGPGPADAEERHPEPDRRRDEASLFLQHPEERAWVGLPLLAAGAPIGALRFSFTRPREITEEERVFLEALAGQCALAVERATLFEREHKTAEELQRSLLPSDLPQVDTMRLAARYHPATRHVQVGGDWYDAFRLPDYRLAVAVGDVMGKGVLAAAGMGRVRNALRALALNDPRPAAVLSGLDRLFSATEDEEQFTTVAYAVIDPETGQGVFSNAGHPPPLLISPDRPARVSTREPGTPLGWPSQRQQTSFSISTGNTVVFYSDGLVENRRRGVDAGLDELVAVAEDAPPEVVGDPERLVDYLVDRMLAGYEQVDDVTVLALHVPPKSA